MHPCATSWPSPPRESVSRGFQVANAPLQTTFACHPQGGARRYVLTTCVTSAAWRRALTSFIWKAEALQRASEPGSYLSITCPTGETTHWILRSLRSPTARLSPTHNILRVTAFLQNMFAGVTPVRCAHIKRTP